MADIIIDITTDIKDTEIFERLEDKIRDLLEEEGLEATIDCTRTGNTTKTRKKEDIGMTIKLVKKVIVHYKNPRKKNRTMCGHDYTVPGRTYSNITSNIDDVTCVACLAVKKRKWFKKMVEERMSKMAKSPKKIVEEIVTDVTKSN